MSTEPTIKRLKGGRVETTVSFSESDVSRAEQEAVHRLGANVELPGFRPGKAPIDVLRQKLDPDRLFEETVRQLLPEAIRSIVETHKLAPIIPPHVDIATRFPLAITITLIEKPEVKMKRKPTVKEKRRTITIEDKDVDQVLQSMLRRHETTAAVDRAAKEGDRVKMDFWGDDEKGQEIPGTRSQNYDVTLGGKSLIPGFEEALVGLKAGDTKDFTITFPEKYHAEHLRGKPATFHVTVHAVEEITRPELTDEFVKRELRAESAAELRTRIKESLHGQEEQAEKQRGEQLAIEALVEATNVELAPELIDHEKRSLLEDIERQLQESGMTPEQWLQQVGRTPEQFEEDLGKQAQQRLKVRFGMDHMIAEHQISVTDEDVEKEVADLLTQVPDEQLAEARQAYTKGERGFEQLKWKKTVDKAMGMILGEE